MLYKVWILLFQQQRISIGKSLKRRTKMVDQSKLIWFKYLDEETFKLKPVLNDEDNLFPDLLHKPSSLSRTTESVNLDNSMESPTSNRNSFSKTSKRHEILNKIHNKTKPMSPFRK